MAAYRVATRLRFATAHSELQHVRHGASFGSLCAKTLYAIIPKNVMLPARNESIDRPFCDLSACHKLVSQYGVSSNQDRKSVVEGKSVSVRVDLGGGRNIKKQTQCII